MACLKGCVPLDSSTPFFGLIQGRPSGEIFGHCIVEGLERGVCPLTFHSCMNTLGRRLGRGLALWLGLFKDLQCPSFDGTRRDVGEGRGGWCFFLPMSPKACGKHEGATLFPSLDAQVATDVAPHRWLRWHLSWHLSK